MEKLFNTFLIIVVLSVFAQTTKNITTLNKAMRVQSAVAQNK
jgi:hypothetical protein